MSIGALNRHPDCSNRMAMNILLTATASHPSAPAPKPARGVASPAPRLPVWEERARKMGFPPSAR